VAEYEQLWNPSVEINRCESFQEMWDGDVSCKGHREHGDVRRKSRRPRATVC
jgi:hypothetical protein